MALFYIIPFSFAIKSTPHRESKKESEKRRKENPGVDFHDKFPIIYS